MGKCIKCGQKGLFLKVNMSGICSNCDRILTLEKKEQAISERIESLNNKLVDKEALKNHIQTQALEDIEGALTRKMGEIDKYSEIISSKQQELEKLTAEVDDSQKKINSNAVRVQKLQSTYKSLQHALKKQSQLEDISNIDEKLISEVDEFISATVELKLNCMSVKQLRSLFNQNKKIIKDVLEKYKSRYTTKTNMAIYQLMVMALEAELQNVLYNIKFGKIENAVKNIKDITNKYQIIASDGNKSIAPTVAKFIGEIEYLYIEAVKIEYEYFVQKERIKEEQRALRDQMRQEAEERKKLEAERKKIEREEEKYKNEIAILTNQMSETLDQNKIKAINQRIEEIEKQLQEVEHKKEEITRLQHGKAGYVYVISNLGAFGEDIFKIGMTRRLEPQERINELSGASVPFPFDVHCFIFSDNAVELENSLHKTLHNRRLNKVNLRKEFFRISIDELEEVVYSIQPTSEFNRTLLAEQYNISLSIDDIPESFPEEVFEDSDEDDEI